KREFAMVIPMRPVATPPFVELTWDSDHFGFPVATIVAECQLAPAANSGRILRISTEQPYLFALAQNPALRSACPPSIFHLGRTKYPRSGDPRSARARHQCHGQLSSHSPADLFPRDSWLSVWRFPHSRAHRR